MNSSRATRSCSRASMRRPCGAATRRRADESGRARGGQGCGPGARSTRGAGARPRHPARQRAHARLDAERPSAPRHRGELGHPSARGLDERGVAGTRGRLGQLGHDERHVAEVVVLEGLARRRERGFVPADAVVEHRRRVGREVRHPAHAERARLARLALDQLDGRRLQAAPRRQQHLGVEDGRRAGRLGDRTHFLDRLRRRRQLTPQQPRSHQRLEPELEQDERAHVAGDLHMPAHERMPALCVPQLHRGDRAGPGTGEPEPAADVAADLQGEDGVQRATERRGSCGVAVRHPRRQGVHQKIDRLRRPPGRTARPGPPPPPPAARPVRPTSPRRGP